MNPYSILDYWILEWLTVALCSPSMYLYVFPHLFLVLNHHIRREKVSIQRKKKKKKHEQFYEILKKFDIVFWKCKQVFQIKELIVCITVS